MDSKKEVSLKSLLLRAWRERWPDMHWSIHVKQLLGPVLETGDCNALTGKWKLECNGATFFPHF